MNFLAMERTLATIACIFVVLCVGVAAVAYMGRQENERLVAKGWTVPEFRRERLRPFLVTHAVCAWLAIAAGLALAASALLNFVRYAKQS